MKMKLLLMKLYFRLRGFFGDERKWYLARQYYKIRRRVPDFDNPTDLSEYILARMIYERNDVYAPHTDKVLVKDYVHSKGLGHIVPKCLGVWDSADKIDWSALPERFAVKCNHGCGYNIICSDRSKFDIEAAKLELDGWAGVKYSRYETHYHHINPRIFAEEFIDEGTGALPVDYKFMCFRGEPFLVLACKDRGHGNLKLYLYDLDWNHKSEYLSCPEDDHDTVARPANLDAMIEYARVLSRDFDFVRVDFYDTGDAVWFGELTFTPAWGMMKYFSDSGLRDMHSKLAA